MELNLFNTAQLQTAQAKTADAVRNLNVSEGQKQTARKAAESFESMVLSQMLAPMFATVATDGEFGGGHSEAIYRAFLVDEIGKSVVKRGGVGIADTVYRQLLAQQEV